MKKSNLGAAALAVVLTLSLSAAALADTIRLRDGSVVRGQIIAFKDQQFTVLIGSGTRGRRGRMTIYSEDIESIEFDTTDTTAGAGNSNDPNDDRTAANSGGTTNPPRNSPPATTRPQPDTTIDDRRDNTAASTPAAGGAPVFFPIRLRVRSDNASNGWNDSGLMVRAGQRLRITATGRVSLGGGNMSTPTGLPRLADRDKLMRNEPTGALIAVIGDDNDDFIFVGASREFTAQRDGRLFLGVNEGNLGDNSGTFEVTVEAEALTGSNRP
ncbi:MAG TPA: LecA/PA-IL family lectin [Pyrinomonadaceae bacterium]|nr:LecA/PA-IL family lectin [Pyrinomonadaceae bacterium]